MKKIPIRSTFLSDYWLKYYSNGHCSLCGNHGYIDSRGVKTPAGLEVGRINYCICPNGQQIRYNSKDLPNGGLPEFEKPDMIWRLVNG